MTPMLGPDHGSNEEFDLGVFVPTLRDDFVRRDFDDETVVWSPDAAQPAVLDPVARVMLDVIDGEASVAQLAIDVHEEVGVPLQVAREQLARIIAFFAQSGLLASPPPGLAPSPPTGPPDIFASSPTPCSENASRLGTVTINLQFGDQRIRVSCDSRRGAKRLRRALDDHVVDGEDAPLGFVLTAPQGFHREHTLTDRSGLALSTGRGLDSGLRALGSHLTALIPAEAGMVRIRARAALAAGGAVVFVFPLLYVPAVEERDLVAAGAAVVDRLALDVDVSTGRIVHPEIPWPALASLTGARGHAGPGGSCDVRAVVMAAPPGSPPPTRATVVATLAGSGIHGSLSDLVDAASQLCNSAELHVASPGDLDLAALLAPAAPS